MSSDDLRPVLFSSLSFLFYVHGRRGRGRELGKSGVFLERRRKGGWFREHCSLSPTDHPLLGF